MTCDAGDELDLFYVIRDRHLFELLSLIVAGAIRPRPHRNDRIRATELRVVRLKRSLIVSRYRLPLVPT